jgi:hypothetical protein
MVVHETHRLHERVDRGRADEAPAATLQVLRERLRLRCLSELRQGLPGHQLRPCLRVGLETPDVGRERLLGLDELDGALSVVDRRFDLAAVADDRRVGEQPLDVAVAEPSNLVEVEAGERAPECLAFAEDRQPREPGLKAFQTELLEQPAVVRDREAPFGVVIGAVLGRRIAPEATDDSVLAADQPFIDYLKPTTIDMGPTRCLTSVSLKPASAIQRRQSAPV